MPPEITLLFLLLIIVKLILKRGLINTPTPQSTRVVSRTRKTRSDKGTHRVKHLPYADYELDVRESVQQFE